MIPCTDFLFALLLCDIPPILMAEQEVSVITFDVDPFFKYPRVSVLPWERRNWKPLKFFSPLSLITNDFCFANLNALEARGVTTLSLIVSVRP